MSPTARPLPFVVDPIVDLPPAHWTRLLRIWDMNDELDDVGRIDVAVAVADALEWASSGPQPAKRPLPIASLERVRESLANPETQRTAQELERIAGLDRFRLARAFRAAFGTSPSRFRTMRQLDVVRRGLNEGRPCADAAMEAGFADQSHMTRMFKRAYGLTPARWPAATRLGRAHSSLV